MTSAGRGGRTVCHARMSSRVGGRGKRPLLLLAEAPLPVRPPLAVRPLYVFQWC
ncbi:hypothetical protein D187_006145 [Cystobacter fuscus DSM 2262]|uniref:Uncharacterized protein n=1 Tax=Cystobacter fuscus (strain ATCC 25194 / DSM 2262 / NBRC 100088 / M29) TaxID=1242864 RepID=S9PL44_CYSF2|nr:hypothetical protein D187_006145 [Cystobacter fuscus DSM 2262]